MSISQNIARYVLTDSGYDSVRQESEAWAMACPCGAETSVWQMGGIRWKARGAPHRLGRCASCGQAFWGRLYRRRQRAQFQVMNEPSRQPIELDATTALLLWIDGVGCWMVFPRAEVTIGGPVEPGASQGGADLCVLANLRRQQGTIERTGESWRWIAADSSEPQFLKDGQIIDVAGKLAMTLRIPSVLSLTAVLTPGASPWPRMFSGRRTPLAVDGIVLMDEVCLLGPGSDAHIPCRDWQETVILFRRNDQLWCRSQGDLIVDGETVSGSRLVGEGAVLGGPGYHFRIESVARGRFGE